MSQPDDLEVVDLSAPGPDPALEGDRRKPWHGWAAVAGVLAVGFAAGAYGAHAYAESADAAHVDLIGARIDSWQISESGARLFVPVYNNGGREVAVASAVPEGWDNDLGQTDPLAASVEPGEWRTIVVPAMVRCDVPVPARLSATVLTDAGPVDVTIPLVPDDVVIADVHRSACEADDDGDDIYLTWEEPLEFSEPEPGVREVDVGLFTGHPEVEITGASSRAFGFRGEATGLPIVAKPHGHVRVIFRWVIDDCAATHDLADVAAVITVASGDDTRVIEALFPASLTAGLARFAAAECGP